jgi:hypothetical protein
MAQDKLSCRRALRSLHKTSQLSSIHLKSLCILPHFHSSFLRPVFCVLHRPEWIYRGCFLSRNQTGNSLMEIGRHKERKTTMSTVARPMTVIFGLFGMRSPNCMSVSERCIPLFRSALRLRGLIRPVCPAPRLRGLTRPALNH